MKLRQYQIDLVEQVKNAWIQGFKAPCIVLGCGGGKSCIVAEIARRTTWNGKRVLFLVHRKELVEQINKTFLKWGVDMNFCYIGMVQTVTRRIHKLARPALIITDENHHSLANSYKNIYEHFQDVPRVGVTATPVRLNGDGLGDVNDRLIVGVSSRWLIENQHLAPYEYFAPSVADLTGLHTKAGEYVTSDIERAMIKKAVFGDVIRCYKKLADGKKAICYCASVKHSQLTAEEFESAGIPAAHIDGTTPTAIRSQVIADFRAGKIRILCNVDLISEGSDVPDCECAILLRPTQSLTLFIQQSMRCMRYKPQKIAIIIDHVGNYLRFGMPDDDREWSLGRLEKSIKKVKQEENSQKIIQCPECFFTFAPTNDSRKCPHCGYELPKKTHEIGKEEVAELVKIEGFTLNLKSPEECKNYTELLNYAKTRGYKPGWAYFQAKQRGLLA